MKTLIEQAYELLGRSQSISDYINIPTQIKKDVIEQKTESHPNFRDYDHSSEINRLHRLREKYNYVEPESIIVDKEDVIVENTQEIEPSEVPNLNGLFDDNFNV
jgi:hypothetical protein